MEPATNKPYVKRYHVVDGVTELGNPITKDAPYRNDGSNRQNRKMKSDRHRSNKKGISLIVNKQVVPDGHGGAIIMVSKVRRIWQQIKANTVVKKITTGKIRKKTTEVEVHHSARTIGHYKLVN